MNKKDFWSLMLFDIVGSILLIEHLAGLEIALEMFLGWSLISFIVHACVLKDYVRITVEEDYV